QLREEESSVFVGFVFLMGERDAGCAEMIFFESGIEADQIEECAQHEAGADQEYRGQADLSHDERTAKPVLALPCCGAADGFLKAFLGIGARGLYRRSKAK